MQSSLSLHVHHCRAYDCWPLKRLSWSIWLLVPERAPFGTRLDFELGCLMLCMYALWAEQAVALLSDIILHSQIITNALL